MDEEVLARISLMHSENVNFFGVIDGDCDGELARLDTSGFRPLRGAITDGTLTGFALPPDLRYLSFVHCSTYAAAPNSLSVRHGSCEGRVVWPARRCHRRGDRSRRCVCSVA